MEMIDVIVILLTTAYVSKDLFVNTEKNSIFQELKHHFYSTSIVTRLHTVLTTGCDCDKKYVKNNL